MSARVLLIVALVVWATCFVSSFALVMLVQTDGNWLWAALDRFALFFIWQGIAALVAVMVLVIGFWVEKTVKWRWLMFVPIAVAGLELVAVGGVFFRVGGSALPDIGKPTPPSSLEAPLDTIPVEPTE